MISGGKGGHIMVAGLQNLEEKFEKLETRTDSLEALLGQFIVSVNAALIRMERGIGQFREEVRADTESFKKEVKADTESFKDGMKADTEAFKKEVRADTESFKDGMKADTEAFKEEMKADMKKHREEMNRRWGDLANKMGTLVEDMVAPNMTEIARKYFNDAAFDFFAVRLMKRKTGENAVRKEFDIIAVSVRNFYIAETKSKPKPEHVAEFSAVLKELPEYFPECRDKKIIPVFSSLYIPEEVQKHLTGHKIYAMGIKEGTMELLNFEELQISD